MAPIGKKVSASVDRRKSASGKPSLTYTFTVPSDRLRSIVGPAESPLKKEESASPKESKESQESPAPSATIPAPPASNNENASDSSPNTPAAGDTPAPQAPPMGPPLEGPKKKGTKRSAAAVDANGEPKVRAKPGPKSKKQKLDEGPNDTGRPNGLGAAHKLGPKANQGAINAGLRALDRSGKPCRKWNKGGFTLKSFTGVVWEIPRWTAPPKPKPESTGEDSTTVSADSLKENKEDSQMKSENSNNGADLDGRSVPSVNASSPAPVAIPVA